MKRPVDDINIKYPLTRMSHPSHPPPTMSIDVIAQNSHKGGKLFIFHGTTPGGGKSWKLLEAKNRLDSVDVPSILISVKGTRRGPVLCTHSGVIYDSEEMIEDELMNADLNEYVWILLDEAQFVSNLVEFVHKWYIEKNKCLIIAGLTTFHNGKPWGHILDLFHMGATGAILINGLCSICKKRQAVHARRRDEDSHEKVEIGGADIYYSICRHCATKQ